MNPILFVIAIVLLIHTTTAILDRQFYNALHVPISAGPDQVKQAYRKLSRKYHPDRNPNSRKKFQKINVAYQTLSNQQRKYLYDRLGKEKMDDPNVQQQKNLALLKGANLQVKLTLTLQDLYSGKQITSAIFKKMACPHCQGSGAQNQYDIVRCSNCQGQGKITKRVQVGGGFYNMMAQTCNRCGGKGKIIGRKCTTCDGGRIISGSEEFKVKIIPGTFDGEILKYTNMGDQLQQGAPGDVFVRIVQARHPRFVRKGHQLHTQVTISLKQALFGFSRTINQLDNRELLIKQEQITQPGQYIVINGQGMPIPGTQLKGDMIVKVNVVIPLYNQEKLEKLQNLFKEIDL